MINRFNYTKTLASSTINKLTKNYHNNIPPKISKKTSIHDIQYHIKSYFVSLYKYKSSKK